MGGRTEGRPLPDSRECRRRECRGHSGRVSHRAGGSYSGWFLRRQDCSVTGDFGNAVTQLARASGAKHAMSSTTNHAKAEQAKALGFHEVIDTSSEKLGDGVRRITDGYGADIVIDGVGGEVLSEALKALALRGNLTTLGYSASRKTTIDV